MTQLKTLCRSISLSSLWSMGFRSFLPAIRPSFLASSRCLCDGVTQESCVVLCVLIY